MDILTNLYATYTVITNADWLAKDKRFFGAYSPPPTLVRLYGGILMTQSFTSMPNPFGTPENR